MRDILFRGKRIDNGEWETGSLVYARMGTSEEQAGIADKMTAYHTPVIPKTVGQYTGLTDKNGKKIFEGDICWFYGGDYYSGLWEQNAIVAITDMTDDEQTHYLNNAEYCEVIGNIYDNPELMGGNTHG